MCKDVGMGVVWEKGEWICRCAWACVWMGSGVDVHSSGLWTWMCKDVGMGTVWEIGVWKCKCAWAFPGMEVIARQRVVGKSV